MLEVLDMSDNGMQHETDRPNARGELLPSWLAFDRLFVYFMYLEA